MCSIVSQSQSFSKNLSRHLADILTPLLGSFSPAHLRDSVHLKSIIQEEADPSLPFLSLDVSSLFTNVPVEPLLDFLRRKHEEGGVPLPEGYDIDGFLDLIRLCVRSTVFSFNGKFYRQKQGVAMGSPLAPVLACLYMEMFETDLRLSMPGPQPSLWYRFIDDIILQWPHSREDFDTFLSRLNQLETLINLQVEWEIVDSIHPGCATMPFLDLCTTRSPSGFDFSVYRKPTCSNIYTHFFSAHLDSTKRGVLISLFLRAHRLCDSNNISAEIDYVRNAFLKLKYPSWFIDQALAAARSKYHNPVVRQPRKTSYYLSLPYHPALKSLRPALSKIGVCASFSSHNTLRSQLSRTGPKAPSASDSPGVYMIQCKKCPEGVYFGETGRTLKKRIDEHKGYIQMGDQSSALLQHMINHPGHSFDLQGASLIYRSNDVAKRQLVESALIATRDTCNLRPGFYPVCRLSASAIIQSLKLESRIVPYPVSTNQSPLSTPVGPPVSISPSEPPSTSLSTESPTVPTTSTSLSPTNNTTVSTATILPTESPSAPPSLHPNTVPANPSSHSPTNNISTPPVAIPPLTMPPVTSAAQSPSDSVISSPMSPIFLQSQARALPVLPTRMVPPCSPKPSPRVTRSQSRTRKPFLLSPYSLPSSRTGAISKRSKRTVTSHHLPTPEPSQSTPAPTFSTLLSPRPNTLVSRPPPNIPNPIPLATPLLNEPILSTLLAPVASPSMPHTQPLHPIQCSPVSSPAITRSQSRTHNLALHSPYSPHTMHSKRLFKHSRQSSAPYKISRPPPTSKLKPPHSSFR